MQPKTTTSQGQNIMAESQPSCINPKQSGLNTMLASVSGADLAQNNYAPLNQNQVADNSHKNAPLFNPINQSTYPQPMNQSNQPMSHYDQSKVDYTYPKALSENQYVSSMLLPMSYDAMKYQYDYYGGTLHQDANQSHNNLGVNIPTLPYHYNPVYNPTRFQYPTPDFKLPTSTSLTVSTVVPSPVSVSPPTSSPTADFQGAYSAALPRSMLSHGGSTAIGPGPSASTTGLERLTPVKPVAPSLHKSTSYRLPTSSYTQPMPAPPNVTISPAPEDAMMDDVKKTTPTAAALMAEKVLAALRTYYNNSNSLQSSPNITEVKTEEDPAVQIGIATFDPEKNYYYEYWLLLVSNDVLQHQITHLRAETRRIAATADRIDRSIQEAPVRHIPASLSAAALREYALSMSASGAWSAPGTSFDPTGGCISCPSFETSPTNCQPTTSTAAAMAAVAAAVAEQAPKSNQRFRPLPSIQLRGPVKRRFHRRTAAEVPRLFHCPYYRCNKSYGTEGSLKLHIRRIHGGLPGVSLDHEDSAVSLQAVTKAVANAITNASTN
eukprot:Platyproteum_vivax@DN522_c0_g1_i1.p1